MIETYEPPSQERIKEFEAAGLTLDELGRPLHPWLETHNLDLPDETTLWRWGPNPAADAIILNTDHTEVLLIQRSDGSWASAGGFVDDTDPNATAAAAREAGEEAGIELQASDALPVYNGIVNDIRSSKYSWVTTSAFLWRRSIQLDTLTAGDDAKGIRLAHLADVRSERLYGSHNFLIDQAIEKHGTLFEKLHYYRHETTSQTLGAGHMEYEKYIACLPSGLRLFIKKHCPQLHADNDRSERLLHYLEKEYAAYQYLKTHHYSHIPDHIEFRDGTIIMQSYEEKDGWVWEAPDTGYTPYVKAALTAIHNLEAIPLETIDSNVAPSHLSYRHEGWDAYRPKSRDRIIRHLHTYASQVRDDAFSKDALLLAETLDSLYADASRISFDEPMVTCHHDFRQSNFAYHPEHGVRIVDWSWIGPGMKGSDATTFLIDLHKQGRDVSEYMHEFNRDHALTMIGFWLMRGSLPAHSSTDVRFQQIHSAVAAHMLLTTSAKN